MKKKIVLFVTLLILSITCFMGCGNRQIIDTIYTFQKAIISLPNGEVVAGEVQSWGDYEGEQIQVKMKTGESYLVHSSNIILIAE